MTNHNQTHIPPDIYGRKLKYLRISITDKCNFSCKYCKPNNISDISSEALSYDDIIYVAEVSASLGINRLRITGGEPLVREGIVPFISKISKIPNINEVMMTTNGSLLTKYAAQLYDAGLTRLNISLDTLDPEKFRYITGSNSFDETLKGIRTAIKVGFKQTKLNAVMIKGFNDNELLDFVDFAAKEDIVMRFIEPMPVGNHDLWKRENIITADMILEKLASFNPIQLDKNINSGPAVNYQLSNGAIIGVITPISKHFCDKCDKLRLTSDGFLRSCLLDDREIDINDAITSRDSGLLIERIKQAISIKAKEYDKSCLEENNGYNRTMSKIGG